MAEACDSLVWAGRLASEPWYRRFLLGGNARMTEMQGALLSVQLSRLETQVQLRMARRAALDRLFTRVEGIAPWRSDPARRCTAAQALEKGGYEAADAYVFYGHPAPFAGEAEQRVRERTMQLMEECGS